MINSGCYEAKPASWKLSVQLLLMNFAIFRKIGFVLSTEDSEQLHLILAESRKKQEAQQSGRSLRWFKNILVWTIQGLLIAVLLVVVVVTLYVVWRLYF